MRLSNKLTFSLASIFLLLAFAAVPAMANTMSATWSIDLDDEMAGNQSGWTVTLTYVTAPATLPTDASITPVGATVEDFKPTVDTTPAAVAGTTKVFTFKVQLTNVSTDADITLTDHRRVTLTNTENLASTSIYTPKLKSITAPKSARAGTFNATIEFERQADPVTTSGSEADGIGPATGLKVADIGVTSGSVLSVMDNGDRTYTVRAVLTGADVVITLADAFPHQDAPDGDDTGTDADAENSATVIYDNELPVIGPIVFKSLTNRDLDTSSVTGAFDVFVDHITEEVGGVVPAMKSIIDEPSTVSDEDDYPLVFEFTVEPANRGATVSNVGRIDGKPAATITPKRNTTSTNWPATTLTVLFKVTDAAGNSAVKRALFTVAPRAATSTGPVDPTGDTTKPSVRSIMAPATPIAAGQPNAGSLVFTITFSEALKDGTFTLSDLVITNVNTQTAHSMLVKDTTDPKIYKLTVTPLDATFPVKVSFHPDATVMDPANNESVAGIDKDATYTPKGVLGVDIKAPDKPLNGSLVFTFEFAQAPVPAIDANGDKDIRGFTISDVEASNAKPLVESDLRKSVSDDKVYYLTVTPLDPRLAVMVTLHDDAVVADASPENMDNDDALVAGLVSATFTPDITAPTLAITHTPADSVAVGSGGMVTFTFTFTDENTIETSGAGAFTTDDVAVVGGAEGTFTATNNKTYTLMVTPATPYTNVTVTVAAGSVTDTAVPPNAIAASVSETWTAPTPPGTIRPTLRITHTPADQAALPVSGYVTFTFTFNKALGSNDNGFSLKDVTIENGEARDFRGSGLVYMIDVEPMDDAMDVTVNVAANAVSDLEGNNLAAAVSETYMADDTVAPTVVITADAATGSDAGKVVFKFTFSEPISGFTHEDLIRGTGVTLAGNPTMDSTNNKVWTVLVNPSTSGDTILTLKTGSVMDMQGNMLVGDQTHTYEPRVPPGPATITNTNLGSTAAGATLTITFNKDPGTVTAGGNTLAGSGTTRTFTAATTIGSNSLPLTWTGTDADTSDNGSGTVTYTVTVFVSQNPTTPSNIMMVTIPANSYVVLVRADSSESALQFPDVPPVNGEAVQKVVWGAMPDLHDLFLTSTQNRGGAIVLRKSADAGDNMGTYANPAVGTVGISEIMWARDLGQSNAAAQAAGQWIELQNLNDKLVKVLIYAQKGSDGLVSGGQLVNTAAGDSLLGNPGGMVIDAIQNIRNDGNQGNSGWNVKGAEGNSVTGQNFASMHRILPHQRSKYENRDGSRYNNRKGTHANHWAESGVVYLRGQTTHTSGGVTNVPLLFEYRGTPGDVNARTGIAFVTRQGRSFKPASNTIVINEVANREDDKYSWIELRNASGGEINLRNYMISIVTSNTSDVPLIQFPANDNAKIKAGGVFLILASDPDSVLDKIHPVSASGYNVGKAMADQSLGTRNKSENPIHYMVHNFALPDNGEFVLMVRRPDNTSTHRSGAHKDHGVAETGQNDLEKIVDIAGYHPNLAKSGYPNSVSSTSLWPLYNFDPPSFTNNKFDKDTVHRRLRTTTNNDRSGVGAQHNNAGLTAFGNVGWTGVGYKRMAATTAVNGGTPGYGNGALPGAGGAITSAVYISEIMYADDARGNMPQWIELRNPSATLGADLHNWRLTITNHADSMADRDGAWTGKAESTVLLRGLKIKPNSSVLITSRRGPRHETYLPDSDIFVLYPAHRSAFGMTSPSSDIINRYGFKITLYANGHDGNRAKWQLVDEVGNLVATTDNRGRSNDRFDVPRWMWPDANTADGDRISVARTNVLGSSKTNGFTPTSGKEMGGWILSSMDMRTDLIDFTYYGHSDDISTPGQTKKQPLPVELSFFRPTLEDGKIVVRWTTESELDNAGFNVYRSETRDGEFNQVNAELIQGAGTTGERNTYKWVDASAKVGQVYYYQIEDVSFAGERQMLATTKLRGLISAKNKLTTKWGEIKKVQ